MLAGPFYVCWDEKDYDIIKRYQKSGVESFSQATWSSECNSCRTLSCPINTGFAKDKRKIYIDVKESPTFAVIDSE